jgi:hypothetical protein
MEKQIPKYFELVVLCQESEKRVFYRLYVELTDLDRKRWRGGKARGELEMMKHRRGILSALPENVTPLAEGTGRLIHYNIDVWGKAECVEKPRTVTTSGLLRKIEGERKWKGIKAYARPTGATNWAGANSMNYPPIATR